MQNISDLHTMPLNKRNAACPHKNAIAADSVVAQAAPRLPAKGTSPVLGSSTAAPLLSRPHRRTLFPEEITKQQTGSLT